MEQGVTCRLRRAQTPGNNQVFPSSMLRPHRRLLVCPEYPLLDWEKEHRGFTLNLITDFLD